MSHPFDATLKDLLSHSAADLAPVLHLPTNAPTRVLNVDLSTISAATDVAFGFGEPLDAGASRVEFIYEVVRLWQQPLEPFLTGGLGVLPLAPLCQLPPDVPPERALRDVVHQIDQRLVSEAPYGRAAQLMTAAFVLTSLRVPRQALADIFRGVKVMHKSSAFDLYEEKGRVEGLAEGRVEESHRLLLRQGRNRFGNPDAAVEADLRAIRDLDRLERLADAVLTAHSWQEFLATP